jgi:hypothetical protein
MVRVKVQVLFITERASYFNSETKQRVYYYACWTIISTPMYDIQYHSLNRYTVTLVCMHIMHTSSGHYILAMYSVGYGDKWVRVRVKVRVRLHVRGSGSG